MRPCGSAWKSWPGDGRKRTRRVVASRTAWAGVEEEVAAEAAVDGTSPFQQACAACRKARGEALARIDARQAELQAETAKVRGEQRGCRRGGRPDCGPWPTPFAPGGGGPRPGGAPVAKATCSRRLEELEIVKRG